MSFLTKLFVVLLVVVSLLLSAASITFVNSVDDFKVALEVERNKASQADAARSEAQQKLAQLEAGIAEQVNNANNLLNTEKANSGRLQTALDQANVALAEAKSGQQTAELNVARLSAATSAMEASRTQLNQQVADLRETNTRLQTQNGEVTLALEDMTNKFNVANAQLRDTTEQLQQTRSEFDKVSGALRDLGKDPRSVTGGLAAGAPAINGVVRATRSINNLPHAQISVGSDDGVTQGMQFTVLDRTTGQFLGRLTIVAVEPNEAIGRLEGPGVNAVAAGAEVRTQL